jgi:hypothetical protein
MFGRPSRRGGENHVRVGVSGVGANVLPHQDWLGVWGQRPQKCDKRESGAVLHVRLRPAPRSASLAAHSAWATRQQRQGGGGQGRSAR